MGRQREGEASSQEGEDEGQRKGSQGEEGGHRIKRGNGQSNNSRLSSRSSDIQFGTFKLKDFGQPMKTQRWCCRQGRA